MESSDAPAVDVMEVDAVESVQPDVTRAVPTRARIDDGNIAQNANLNSMENNMQEHQSSHSAVNEMPVFVAPNEMPVFVAPNEVPLFAAPNEVPLFAAPNEVPVFAAPNEVPVFAAPNEVPVFAAPNEYPVFVAPKSQDSMVMRKPEPVSNIVEETLDGDPRVEARTASCTDGIVTTFELNKFNQDKCAANKSSIVNVNDSPEDSLTVPSLIEKPKGMGNLILKEVPNSFAKTVLPESEKATTFHPDAGAISVSQALKDANAAEKVSDVGIVEVSYITQMDKTKPEDSNKSFEAAEGMGNSKDVDNSVDMEADTDAYAFDDMEDVSNTATSQDMEDDKDDDDEEEEEVVEEGTSRKTPKKRRKPRRSIYARPKRDQKRAERERTTPAPVVPTEVDNSSSMPTPSTPVVNIDEDSQMSSTSARNRTEVRRFRGEIVVPESTEVFTGDKVMEYVWPLEGTYGEHYFIQEHISQYIGIISFKRKYPDLRRRAIDMAEKDYLKELGIVSEIACDLGLTAVRSEDVMDILFTDFPAKFEELSNVLSERRESQLKERGKVEYKMVDVDKSKMVEYARKAAAETARYNAALNKDKKEERRFSFDLQTFTLHKPLGRGPRLTKQQTKINCYPVAVLPGQYSDGFKRYTSEQLKRLPLNTISPMPKTEENVPVTPKVDVPSAVVGPVNVAEKVHKCKMCNRGKDNNKIGKAEALIVCAICNGACHATCINLNPQMINRITSYGWQCPQCKKCVTCNGVEDADKMVFCDLCDRGHHAYCCGLRKVPTGRWHCEECAVCSSCDTTDPAGGENVKTAEWQHEFRKNKNHKISYATTLCVPCDRLWKRRQFCAVCLKVYRSIQEDNMARCCNCPKYVHRDRPGCSSQHEGELWCDPCFTTINTERAEQRRIIAAAKMKMAAGF